MKLLEEGKIQISHPNKAKGFLKLESMDSVSLNGFLQTQELQPLEYADSETPNQTQYKRPDSSSSL